MSKAQWFRDFESRLAEADSRDFRKPAHGLHVTPYNVPGAYCTGELTRITAKEITRVLGFPPNVAEHDSDKVVNSWAAEVKDADGNVFRIGIWDYKGSHKFGTFSTYGPDEVFVILFSNHYSSD